MVLYCSVLESTLLAPTLEVSWYLTFSGPATHTRKSAMTWAGRRGGSWDVRTDTQVIGQLMLAADGHTYLKMMARLSPLKWSRVHFGLSNLDDVDVVPGWFDPLTNIGEKSRRFELEETWGAASLSPGLCRCKWPKELRDAVQGAARIPAPFISPQALVLPLCSLKLRWCFPGKTVKHPETCSVLAPP